MGPQKPVNDKHAPSRGRFGKARFLAHGGFSTLYEALDATTKEWIALKVPRENPLLDAEARLRREIEIYERLESAHAARFVAEAEFNGRVAMAIELLRGQTLGRKLDRRPLSIEAAIEIACETLSALEALHSLGVVHCDVNPSNVFMHWNADAVEVVKLLDFGISTHIGRTTKQRSEVVGTVPFMAPEQLHGGLATVATDTYAVGALAYSMITGRLLFDGLSNRSQPTMSPSVLRPSCPLDLERFVLRALSERPEERFQDAAEMQRELASIGEKHGYARGALAIGRPSSVPPAASPIADMLSTRQVRDVLDESCDLQILESSARAAPPRKPSRRPKATERVVLVVEDDPSLRHDLVFILEEAGYRVVQATNGKEALALMKRSRLPDVMLMDLMMPVMDGWALRQRMLAAPRLAHVPAVVLSSAGGLSGEAERLKAAAHLEKPVDPLEILRVVSEHTAPASA